MRVVVLGAGVVGVTTAYYLSKAGHHVTVVDRNNEVADCTSYANGGQLSYSFTDALAKPEFIAKIPGLIAGRDTGSKIRLEPSLLAWGVRFLAQCTNKRAEENTLAVLKTAMRSAVLLNELQTAIPFDFSHRTAGKLVLLTSEHELQGARQASALKNQHGSDTQVINVKRAIEIEPALAQIDTDFKGAVYSRSDEVADARIFTLRLKDWLEKSGAASFRLGDSVESLNKTGGKICSVSLSDDEIEAEAVVVCAGAWSNTLLRPLGIHTHIYPVRGYSVTLPLGPDSPSVSISALKERIVFSRINGRMRIAGFADFKGFSTQGDEERIETLIKVAKDYAPTAADYTAAERHKWGGFRPMTPDGQPRVGATGVPGLFLNTGHGMLGWTLACASAHDVAQHLSQ